jgi:hypothetical protein
MLLLFMVVAIASIATVGALRASGAGRSPEDPTERLMLRLHDLPPGYVPFDFSEGNGVEFICDDLDPSDPSPKLAGFVRRFSPQGCLGIYVRVYSVLDVEPSGTVVGTGALDAGSNEAAEMGFSLADQLLGKLTENGIPEEVAPTATVGDATRLFHWKRSPKLFRNSRFGSFLVWRSGTVLDAVFASANSLAASDAIVATLAQRQQAHNEYPTPYTRAERNASEIGLDDPALKLPVYWLGRNFSPGHGLPVARLESAGDPHYDREHLAGPKLELEYSHNLKLGAWPKSRWKRFVATQPFRKFLTEPCLESTRLSLPDRHATVYAGDVEGFRPCAAHSPKWFFAVVHLGGLVITVNPNACHDCPNPARGSYNSLAGMKTVVSALRLRPKPDY